LSQLAIVEEWMDIHLDRWLEHLPMPPDMPDGQAVSYLAMFGSDVRRVWWGAWGDPRGFVPKMADYFKLCNIARSDAALLDQIGEALEPKLVGAWIGVWGNKVTTGWHFWDPHPWTKVEAMFGTHEAKFQLKALGIDSVVRFAQSIGDGAYSEIECTVAEPAVAFEKLTGAKPTVTPIGLSCRVRGGKLVRVAAIAPAGDLAQQCGDAGVPLDDKLVKVAGAIGAVSRIEYARAGDKAGVDVFVEPGAVQPAPAAAN